MSVKAVEQGADRQRYHVVPRTLIFLTRPASDETTPGAGQVLLIKGAPSKRLWANKYNGLGGHVEAHEDIYAAALRELHEESGIHAEHLKLAGIINIDTGHDGHSQRPGVLVFVFTGEWLGDAVGPTGEGAAEWVALDRLADYPLVDDLYEVLPRALNAQTPFYAHYAPDGQGVLRTYFRDSFDKSVMNHALTQR
jgi:8-oxo-dGTP diphosphatase